VVVEEVYAVPQCDDRVLHLGERISSKTHKAFEQPYMSSIAIGLPAA
jgi:hypothetical protein